MELLWLGLVIGFGAAVWSADGCLDWRDALIWAVGSAGFVVGAALIWDFLGAHLSWL